MFFLKIMVLLLAECFHSVVMLVLLSVYNFNPLTVVCSLHKNEPIHFDRLKCIYIFTFHCFQLQKTTTMEKEKSKKARPKCQTLKLQSRIPETNGWCRIVYSLIRLFLIGNVFKLCNMCEEWFTCLGSSFYVLCLK